ncbi:MAG: hypothetical protein LBQ09_00300 [Acidobacteriaceae bacterium]|nr:hypothetical protein [Acidobacteriaceae bacterium]
MTLLPFVEWLASTRGSIALHESLYMYPLIESLHVLTLMLFAGTTALLDFRLLGLGLRKVPLSDITAKLLPWMFTGFAIMVTSGALLFYAIPVRSYQNVFFRAKVILLLLAGLNAWLFHAGIYRSVERWNHDEVLPRRARMAGLLSLVLWALIITSGRMIAYNWFDCDVTTKPTILWLAGCTERNSHP